MRDYFDPHVVFVHRQRARDMNNEKDLRDMIADEIEYWKYKEDDQGVIHIPPAVSVAVEEEVIVAIPMPPAQEDM